MGNSAAKIALVLDPADNAATLLSDAGKGDRITLKGSEGDMISDGVIETGHKIALSHIEEGKSIIKYGQNIGVATTDIKAGEWIHLHNMESVYDKSFIMRID